MEKLDLTTPNITDENVQKIAELFPNCVTEADNGKTQVVDFDLLKQELSDNIVEGNKERYQLTWPGKAESLVTANTPINKTLRPVREESKDFNNTENLYIEGDNLEVLKLLQETYLGKIKMIYIDPPYNTGKDFVYKDNFTQDKAEYDEDAGNVDDEGGRLVSNPDSNGRYHSDWLSMMYPRLKLARNLLKDDGVIFISIDDNEAHNLRKVCDEIFSEYHFLTNISVKLSEPTGVKMSHARQRIPKLKESILLYKRKNTPDIEPSMVNKDRWDQEYKTVCLNISKEELGLLKQIISNEDRTSREKEIAENLLNKIAFKSAASVCKSETNSDLDDNWCFENSYRIVRLVSVVGGAQQLAKERKRSFSNKELPGAFSIITPNGKMYAIKADFNEESNIPRCKLLFSDQYLQVNTGDFWPDIKTTGLDNEGEVDFKNGKKPLKMLKRCIDLIIRKNEIVLDFFCGSATTAHAVMQLNAEDGGNRKFIMAQIPELTSKKSEASKAGYKTIAEIGKERIRRAGEKIKEDNADKDGINELDVGFRVLKVDSSNMKDVYFSPDNTQQSNLLDLASNIKEGRTDEDLLFMVLLDWGIDLSVKIERRVVAGKTVYFADDDYLAACFENNLNKGFVKALVAQNPLKVVFRDNGFANDSVKINVEQIFKQADIEVKVI